MKKHYILFQLIVTTGNPDQQKQSWQGVEDEVDTLLKTKKIAARLDTGYVWLLDRDNAIHTVAKLVAVAERHNATYTVRFVSEE